MRTRSPARTPSPSFRVQEHVRIRHPDYTSNNILFVFDATDDFGEQAARDDDGGIISRTDGRSSAGVGVAWDIVLWACGIVTGNRFDCYLSHERGGERIPRPAHGVLPAGEYFLNVPSSGRSVVQVGDSVTPDLRPAPYPIVPNFKNWTPPLPSEFGSLHHAWSGGIKYPGIPCVGNKPTRAATTQRDRRCLITAVDDPVEVAHLVPTNQEHWWLNREFGSSVGTDSIDHELNCILLSRDAHGLFDKASFSIVPKLTPSEPRQDARDLSTSFGPTLHVWRNDGERLARFHNLRLRQPRGIHPLCLFARFALDIFPMLKNFLDAHRERWLWILSEDGVSKEMKVGVDDCHGLASDQAKAGSKSPSRSPRKSQKRPAQNEDSLDRSFDSGVSGLPADGDTDEEEDTQPVYGQYSAEDLATERDLEAMEGIGSRKRARMDDDLFSTDDSDDASRGRRRKSKRLTSTGDVYDPL